MTDQPTPLSAEQIALLRSLPDKWSPIESHGAAFAELTGTPWIDVDGEAIGRSPAADILLATINSTLEGERWRINDLLAMFTNKFGWMTFATHDPEFPDDDPKGPYGFGRVDTRYEEFDSMGEGASPLEALEAATTNEGTDQ